MQQPNQPNLCYQTLCIFVIVNVCSFALRSSLSQKKYFLYVIHKDFPFHLIDS